MIALLLHALGCADSTAQEPLAAVAPTAFPTAPFPTAPPTARGPVPPEAAALAPKALASLAWSVLDRDPDQAVDLVIHALELDGDAISLYDAACVASRAGHPDAAVAWLQQAAATGEGVDPDHADADPDLEAVRQDPRWTELRTFLAAETDWWRAQPADPVPYTLPPGAAGTVPALVWLHGLGDQPKGLVDQIGASVGELGIAMVGVPATLRSGRASYRWSEDLDRDGAQVRRALDEVEARTGVKLAPVVLLGFSQGAHLADALLARGEPRVDGVIALSPGFRSETSAHAALRPGPNAPARRVAIVSAGAGEAPGTVAQARADADTLLAGGARVELRIVKGQRTHSFPEDFGERFLGWWTLASGVGDRARPARGRP